MQGLKTLFGNGTHDDWIRSFFFQEFILAWIPCVFLFITSPVYFAFTLKSKKSLLYSAQYFLKSGLGIGLIMIYIIDLSYRFHEYLNLVYGLPLHLLQPCALLISEILATFLVTFDKCRGRRINILLFLYRLLMEVSICLVMYASACCLLYPSNFVEQQLGHQHFCRLDCFVILVIALLLNTTLLLLSGCSVEKDLSFTPDKRDSPETRACLLSMLTFFWFSKFVYQSGKRGIDYCDIWQLKKGSRCHEVSGKFHQKWLQCCPNSSEDENYAVSFGGSKKIENHNSRKYEKEDDNLISEAQLLNSGPMVTIRDGQKTQAKNQWSLLNVLYRTFGSLFVGGMCLNITHDLLMFASPYIFKQLIDFIMDDVVPTSKGIIYVVLLIGCSCIQVVLKHQYMIKYNVIGLRVQSTLISSIYKKALVLQSSNVIGVGEIVNLMSVDVQKLVDMVPMVNYLWSCPIQLTLGTFFLWQLLGPSVLGGMFVTLAMLPINGWVAKKCKKFQVNQMRFKDARIKLLDEIINGIKVIKLYAWEAIFEGQVSKVRADELRVIRRAAYLTAVTTFAWCSTPFLISLTTFGLYLLSSPENVLTAEKAFVSLTLFNILRMPLSMLPMFITNVVVAKVSLRRLETFLLYDEIYHQSSGAISVHNSTGSAISLKDAFVGWEKSGEKNVVLSSINLEIPKGCLAAIVGPIGSGKSTLLSAFIGEARLFGGECHVEGEVAYAGQQAWLQNKTLKENILFGSEMDEARYKRSLEASSLLPDLESLQAGDETEVGERGVTLSGGQKQRVCFARAMYSSADVYVFDDPFASVDFHVAKNMFNQGLSNLGLLKDKTRIIATNSISFLPFVDMIIILKGEGRISEVGSYDSLLISSKEFNLFAQSFISDNKASNQRSNVMKRFQSLADEEFPSKDIRECSSIFPLLKLIPSKHHKSCIEINALHGKCHNDDDDTSGSLLLHFSNLAKSETFLEEILLESAKAANQRSNSDQDSSLDGNHPSRGKLVEDEEVKKERVNSKIFLAYLQSIGFLLGFLTFLSFIINNLLSVSTNIWLSIWTDDARFQNLTHDSRVVFDIKNVTDRVVGAQNYKGLGIYAALGFCYILTLLLRSLVSALACSRASKVMYSDLVACLLSVPLSFYDRTPKGRIINRASSDVAILDYVMPFTMSGFCNIVIMCAATLGIIVFNIPLFFVPFLVLLVIYIFLQRFFVMTSRQLRRMTSNLRSHVFSHLNETLHGIMTIRSFRATSRFTDEMFKKVDDMQEVSYLTYVSQRWLGVWLEFIGTLLVSMVALFAVLGRSQLSPGAVALSLTYAFDIIQNLNSLVTMICELETNMVAVERIKEYSDLEPEVSKSFNPLNLPPLWPCRGQIEFQEYSSRYRPNSEFVVKTFSLLIKPGEKIGIVGRTGSGKSSILLSLFRVLDAAEGKIVIDDVDIAHVPLKHLRSSITLVPQDPVVFTGSIRFNLDPLGVCSDKELWDGLAETGLKDCVLELSGHLDHECSPNASSLSQGQQQLLCLNRALLRKSKILLLDEATASIDIGTEEVIKQFIEKKFMVKSTLDETGPKALIMNSTGAGNSGMELCTLIIVAHRISTVLNCDRILVLSDGRLEEMGEPRTLLANKDSRFYKIFNDHL